MPDFFNGLLVVVTVSLKCPHSVFFSLIADISPSALRLSPTESRRIAANIAKLPDVVWKV